MGFGLVGLPGQIETIHLAKPLCETEVAVIR